MVHRSSPAAGRLLTLSSSRLIRDVFSLHQEHKWTVVNTADDGTTVSRVTAKAFANTVLDATGADPAAVRRSASTTSDGASARPAAVVRSAITGDVATSASPAAVRRSASTASDEVSANPAAVLRSADTVGTEPVAPRIHVVWFRRAANVSRVPANWSTASKAFHRRRCVLRVETSVA